MVLNKSRQGQHLIIDRSLDRLWFGLTLSSISVMVLVHRSILTARILSPSCRFAGGYVWRWIRPMLPALHELTLPRKRAAFGIIKHRLSI